MLQKKTQKMSLVTVIAVIIGFSGFLLFFQSQKMDYSSQMEICIQKSGEKKFGQKTIPCYLEVVREIVKKEGIAAALTFTDKEIREKSTFSITHVAMHEIGFAAAEETNDFEKALSYIPDSGHNTEGYFHYDGYQHGVFMVMFRKNKEKRSIKTLIREACPQAFESMRARSDHKTVAVEQCFHAVGHALMYAFDNDPFVALPYCDEMPEVFMQKWCYFGVFMENSYLYSNFHNPEGMRPYVTGNSMLPLCMKVDEKYRLECAKFAGRAYMHVKDGNWRGMFAECKGFMNRKEKEVCVGQAARLFIPMFYKSDWDSMVVACVDTDAELSNICLSEVAVGIRQGAAGVLNSNYPFCEKLKGEVQTQCIKTVADMYVQNPPMLH